ncbi:MAG: glycosyltransferase family 9 protein [Bdellovibrionaceae bacterium]|nr:glycosyltransferase family 9 protein [Pseudobdellovibrionaceae bacterium]
MKILIIQLARLGDIYMSWPIVRALKRKFPSAEIDIIVREKFHEATQGLAEVDQCFSLNSKDIISFALNNIENPTDFLERELVSLKNKNYDTIYNLTFSPLSSYLAYYLSESDTQVFGYNRFSDSSFSIQDSISAYFYSQVGIDKYNRFHLIDVFASLCDVDLIASDFNYPHDFSLTGSIEDNYITLQLGASSEDKTLSPFIWSRVIKKLLSFDLGYKVVLLGSKAEEKYTEEIFAFNSHKDIINLVGKTSLKEVFPILKNATLHVGGDSVFLHMCNLTQTPCLNLSFESVKFWETGPRVKGSYVLLNILPANVESTEVAQAIKSVLVQRPLPQLISYIQGIPCYSLRFNLVNDFEWSLVKAIYLGEAFPMTEDLVFFRAIERLNDINNHIIEILLACQSEGTDKFVKILEAQDIVMRGIARISSKASIYIDWCLAEKIKVPPLTENKIVESYLKVHNELKLLLRPYLLEDTNTQEEEKNHG